MKNAFMIERRFVKSKIIFHDLKMEISVKNGVVARYYGELMYIMYDAPYCWLYFADNTKYKIEATMRYLIDNLPEAFIRCNRSVILNVCYYREYRITLSEVVMDDNRVFTLSRFNSLRFNAMRTSLPRISPPCANCYTCTDECESRSVFCRRKKMKTTMSNRKERGDALFQQEG